MPTTRAASNKVMLLTGTPTADTFDLVAGGDNAPPEGDR